MKGFNLFLICGGNPANDLAECQGLRGVDALRNLDLPAWRLEILSQVQKNLGTFKIAHLIEWAVIENLNEGSHQRAQCPLTLRGSGRWFANDQGGRYRQLMDVLLRWDALTDDARAKFARAEKLFDLGYIPEDDLEKILADAEAWRLKEKQMAAAEERRQQEKEEAA